MIRQAFEDIDADAILRTPLRGEGEDTWGWAPEKHGCYPVRSAYRLLYDEDWHLADQTRASALVDPTWKRIWKLCVPPKIRVF